MSVRTIFFLNEITFTCSEYYGLDLTSLESTIINRTSLEIVEEVGRKCGLPAQVRHLWL